MRYLFVVSALLLALFSFQNCGRILAGSLPQSATDSGSIQLPSSLGPDVLPPRVPLKVDCASVSQGYTTVLSRGPDFLACKQRTEAAPLPVDGTFSFDAILYKERTATDHKLKIRFDMGSLSSGIALRNHRIRDIVFGSAEGYRIEYEATLKAQQVQSAEALAAGESLQLTLNGNLILWGKMMTYSLPVLVTRTSTGFQVSSVTGFFVGIISQMGLQPQLEQLSTFCKAMALDKVTSEFNFRLVNACN